MPEKVGKKKNGSAFFRLFKILYWRRGGGAFALLPVNGGLNDENAGGTQNSAVITKVPRMPSRMASYRNYLTLPELPWTSKYEVISVRTYKAS